MPRCWEPFVREEDPTKQGGGLFKAELPHPSWGCGGGDGSRHRPSRGGVLLAVPGSKIRPVRRRGCLDLERKKHICVLLPAATEGEAVHEKRPRQRRGAASGGRQTCRLDGERGPHCRYSCRKSPIFFFFFFFLFAAEAFDSTPPCLAGRFPPSDRLQHGMCEGGLTPRRLGRELEYLEERREKKKRRKKSTVRQKPRRLTAAKCLSL